MSLRHDHRRRRPQRRHSRGALAHARSACSSTSARQRRARDARRRVRERRDHAGAVAARSTSAARADLLVVRRRQPARRRSDPQHPRSGVGGAHQLSPKASADRHAARRARTRSSTCTRTAATAFTRTTCAASSRSPSVTPLTRAIGEEIGARTRLFESLGLRGRRSGCSTSTTRPPGTATTARPPSAAATHRYGVELETRYEFTPWLAADARRSPSRTRSSAPTARTAAASRSRRSRRGPAASRRATSSAPGVARAGLRFYGIGDRPASDDGAIVAPGFTQVDLHLGYRTAASTSRSTSRTCSNGDFRSAQFDTVSRLRTEPAIGAPVPAGFSCGSNGRLAPRPTAAPRTDGSAAARTSTSRPPIRSPCA